jgi:hypothetical protein
MDRFAKLLFVSLSMLFAGSALAQATQATRINTIPLKNPAPAVNPAAISRIAPAVIALPADAEAQVQAEIKRQQKKRDDISSTLAKVGANSSKLSYALAANSCIDPDTTWNARSGESFSCVGRTTCNGRMSRWSKSRTNPCEPGATIDSCIHSDECKTGSLCDTGAQKCVPR